MNRLNALLNIYVPVFNDHQMIEGDDDLTLTIDQAKTSASFKYWCSVWSDDDRGELLSLLN